MAHEENSSSAGTCGEESLSQEIVETPYMRRTFRDGVRQIDLIIVIKEQENKAAITLRNNFMVNVVKMGLEVEFEPSVMPIHNKLVFFKIHCPDCILCKFADVYGVKCAHSIRADQIMSKRERGWINEVRKEYKENKNLQYSTNDRSLIVYMIMLNMPFGERQNHIGIERLIKQNIIEDVLALHDGPYFIRRDQYFTDINARQVLFYNWAGCGNMFKLQPLNLICEYFGPKIAMLFAFYGLYNLFLVIAAIGGIITLLLSLFKNEKYVDLINPVCDSKQFIALDSRGPIDNKWYSVEYLYDFCPMYLLNTLVDNKFTPFFSAFLMLWGIIFITCWLRKEKYLKYVWETQSKEIIEKLKRPQFLFQRMRLRKSRITGITLAENLHSDKRKIFSMYIGMILLGIIQFFVFMKVNGVIENMDYFQKSFVRIKIMSIIVTAALFVMVLLLLDKYNKRIAYYIIEKENHKTYQSYYWSLARNIFILCFISPFLLLVYYGSHLDYYRLWFGKIEHHAVAIFTYGLTAGIYQLSAAFTIILLARFTILRKLSQYSRRTDYNQSAKIVQNVPCWEREYLLPPLREENLIDKMKILVIQFIFITMFAFASPIIIIIVLYFNIYDCRRFAQLLVLHYRRPLLLKDNAFSFWSWILKRIVYLSILIHRAVLLLVTAVSFRQLQDGHIKSSMALILMSGTEFLELRLREQKRETNDTNLKGYLELMYINHFSKELTTIFYVHVFLVSDRGQKEDFTSLTVEEYRVYQYLYVFIFEHAMIAMFIILRYIFVKDLNFIELPKKKIDKND